MHKSKLWQADLFKKQISFLSLLSNPKYSTNHMLWVITYLLCTKLLVFTNWESINGEGIQYYSWIQDVFLKALKPHIEPFKPHQMSSIWNTNSDNRSFHRISSIFALQYCRRNELAHINKYQPTWNKRIHNSFAIEK